MIHKLSRFLMTLVALFAMTAGAWADDYFYLVVDGTTATLKYGDKGENPYFKDGFVPVWKTSTDDNLDIKGFTTVTVDATCQNITSLPALFQNFTALTVINNLENINTTSITRMAGLFYGCSSLQTLDLSDWNTASVTTMMNMFRDCLSLETIYVGEGWSTEKVTISFNMFTGCTKLPNFDASIVDKTNAYAGGYLKAKPGTVLPTPNVNEWSLTMPAGNVELQVEYYPGMLVKPTNMEGGKLEIEGLTDTTLPEGFEKDDEGNIYVAKGTKFTVKAVPDEGFHLVSWSDDATITDLEREITMGDDDFEFSATFSDKYIINFAAANDNTIESGKATVKVNGVEATLTDGKLKDIPAGAKITIDIDEGYKFKSIETKGEAPATPEGPTLAQTLTTANMTVKVYFTYNDMNNTCEFLSNGDGTYTFQSGTGLVGGDNNKAKALVVENGKLVFKQNFFETLSKLWAQVGFSITFDTSENTYSIWKGSNETITGTLSKVEVNGTQIDVYAAGTTPPAPAGTVIPNEGMTAAEFVMPGYDLKLEYEMSRDMAQNMSMKVGETGEDDFVIRVKKDGAGFVLSEMTMEEMVALVTVTDELDPANPVTLVNKQDYTLQMFAADADGKPTGEAIAFNQLVPATTYVAVATGIGAYDGTVESNTFTLLEAYDLALKPANAENPYNIGGANAKGSVTVDGEAATPDANGKIKNIEPGQKVVLKTTGPDYIIRKATVKKKEKTYTITPRNARVAYDYGNLTNEATLPYNITTSELMKKVGLSSVNNSYNIQSVSLTSGSNVTLGTPTGTPGERGYEVPLTITGEGEFVLTVGRTNNNNDAIIKVIVRANSDN